jgi:hypothetical protein
MEQTATVALIGAGHHAHAATEEAARTRLGFFRLTKGGQTSSNSDRVFAELVHERSCRPRPPAVSGPLDKLRHAFVDHTLEASLHAASKAADGAALAKATPNKPPGHDAKAEKAAAKKRKATAAAPTTSATGTKPGNGTKPPTK